MCNASGSTEALPSLHYPGSAGPGDCGQTSRADFCSDVGNLGICPRMVRKQTQPNHHRRLDTTLCTFMPGPGDHFDFVRMPVHSGMTANYSLTTQSEEEPG
jgi:hypothetical protein